MEVPTDLAEKHYVPAAPYRVLGLFAEMREGVAEKEVLEQEYEQAHYHPHSQEYEDAYHCVNPERFRLCQRFRSQLKAGQSSVPFLLKDIDVTVTRIFRYYR